MSASPSQIIPSKATAADLLRELKTLDKPALDGPVAPKPTSEPASSEPSDDEVLDAAVEMLRKDTAGSVVQAELSKRFGPDQDNYKDYLARAYQDLAVATPAEPEPADASEPEPAPSTTVPYPPELAPLIVSGKVVYDPAYQHWLVRRCKECGEFCKDSCCGEIQPVSAALHDNKTLTSYGKQALGIIPIKRPEPPKPPQEIWKGCEWWSQFRGVEELEGDGNVVWVIQNVLPAGVTVITSNPKDGKSFIVASFVKAITSGQSWLGRVGFEVPEPMPVLWLAAESGDPGLRIRCEKFNITKDKSRFICRTLTQGMIDLNDPLLETLVKAMKPYVVLETLIRFGDGEDEDNAKDANRLAKMIFRLIAWGARGVLCIHHARKDLKRGGIDLEKAVRGSGDYAAMADAIWVLVRDENLYQKGKGPNEIMLSGWGRDFNPYPMRLALTKKAPKDLPKTVITFAPGLISVIDEVNDLGWVDDVNRIPTESTDQQKDTLEQMIRDDSTVTSEALAEATGMGVFAVKATLKDMGYKKPSGRSKKGHPHRWKKS